MLTKNAEEKIKQAAEQRDEQLYSEIVNVDLISKEFMYHKHCYTNFVRVNNELNSNDGAASKSVPYDKGDFVSVKNYVNENILEAGRVVSMEHLHSLFQLGEGDSRYTFKLKERLKKEFGEKITFLHRTGREESDVVMGTNHIDSFISCTDTQTIQNAAELIAREVKEKFRNKPDITWPPSSEELAKEEWKAPPSIITFLTALFNSGNNFKYLSNLQTKLIGSIASDLVYGLTGGKTLQLKHFLLALGLHDLTGSRKVVDIVNGLGHCLSYNTTMDIKTGVAEQLLEQINRIEILPLQPLTEQSIAPTYFWVDNFDMNIDRVLGGGAINNTHLMAFQEITDGTRLVMNPKKGILRKKSRQLFYEDLNTQTLTIDSQMEPPQFVTHQSCTYASKEFDMVYFLWTYIRNINMFQQIVPSFKGFILQVKQAVDDTLPVKTVETFLPPITAKVTDFNTIQKYLTYLQKLSNSVNMPYVNVTLDVGAAINAFKTVWNHPDVYKNVVIHLGGFHFLKENFQVSIVN